MNILSLFDGISCGRLALERANIKIDKYYASEIEKSAIKVAQYHYPDTIQLGDVTKWREWDIDWGSINLLIGGSPCQGFSIAGKQLNFKDSRSKLFFEFVDILNHIKKFNPNIKFLLENVKMKDEIANKITELLGTEKVYINSKYFTGQIRKRYYWCNFHIPETYERKDLKLRDVINASIPYNLNCNKLLDRTEYAPTISSDGIITINPRDKNGKQTWQRGRIYDINGACAALCATLFDLNITKDHKYYRKLTIAECEKLQGLPIGYTSILSKNDAGKAIGNG